MRCSDGRGFELTVGIPDRIRRGGRIRIAPEHVRCELEEGVTVACEGYFEGGRMRLDAVDQDKYHWFWLEISAVKVALAVAMRERLSAMEAS